MKENRVGGNRIKAALFDLITVKGLSFVLQFIIYGEEIIKMFSRRPLNSKEFIPPTPYFLGCVLITLLISIVLLTVIPMFNENRATIGKLMFSLKVVGKDGKKPDVISMIIRNINLWISFVLGIVLIIIAQFQNKELMYIYTYIALVEYAIYIVILVDFGSNKTPFYDSLAKTKVVDTEYKLSNKEETKINDSNQDEE